MYEISVEDEFSAAHRLFGYEGNCERLHGHNWRVRVTVKTQTLDDRGLALDFKILKRALRMVLDILEHRHLNEVAPFDLINPTCENLAKFVYSEVRHRLPPDGARLAHVRIWESARAFCTYSEDDHDNG